MISFQSTEDTNGKSLFALGGGTFTAGKVYCAAGAAPGAGKSWTFTVSVGGVSKGVCTISGTGTTGSTALTPFGVTAGLLVKVATANVGAPTTKLYAVVITP